MAEPWNHSQRWDNFVDRLRLNGVVPHVLWIANTILAPANKPDIACFSLHKHGVRIAHYSMVVRMLDDDSFMVWLEGPAIITDMIRQIVDGLS